jgi:hypothetical protein
MRKKESANLAEVVQECGSVRGHTQRGVWRPVFRRPAHYSLCGCGAKRGCFPLPLADFAAGVVASTDGAAAGAVGFCATCGTAPFSGACCTKSLVSYALSGAMVKRAILDTWMPDQYGLMGGLSAGSACGTIRRQKDLRACRRDDGTIPFSSRRRPAH